MLRIRPSRDASHAIIRISRDAEEDDRLICFTAVKIAGKGLGAAVEADDEDA